MAASIHHGPFGSQVFSEQLAQPRSTLTPPPPPPSPKGLSSDRLRLCADFIKQTLNKNNAETIQARLAEIQNKRRTLETSFAEGQARSREVIKQTRASIAKIEEEDKLNRINLAEKEKGLRQKKISKAVYDAFKATIEQKIDSNQKLIVKYNKEIKIENTNIDELEKEKLSTLYTSQDAVEDIAFQKKYQDKVSKFVSLKQVQDLIESTPPSSLEATQVVDKHIPVCRVIFEREIIRQDAARSSLVQEFTRWQKKVRKDVLGGNYEALNLSPANLQAILNEQKALKDEKEKVIDPKGVVITKLKEDLENKIKELSAFMEANNNHDKNWFATFDLLTNEVSNIRKNRVKIQKELLPIFEENKKKIENFNKKIAGLLKARVDQENAKVEKKVTELANSLSSLHLAVETIVNLALNVVSSPKHRKPIVRSAKAAVAIAAEIPNTPPSQQGLKRHNSSLRANPAVDPDLDVDPVAAPANEVPKDKPKTAKSKPQGAQPARKKLRTQ